MLSFDTCGDNMWAQLMIHPEGGIVMRAFPEGIQCRVFWRSFKTVLPNCNLSIINLLFIYYLEQGLQFESIENKRTAKQNASAWKRRFILETIIFRFHVKLWEGSSNLRTFLQC